jgi:hypothetical protein
VPFPQYDWTTPVGTVNPFTHALEFQTPFERHVYEYDGQMVYSTNRRVDFGVTPDHQMYVRKWDERRRTLSDKYSFVRAGDLGWYAGLLHAPSGQIGTDLVEVEVPGDRRYDGDDFLALLGLIVSDGYAGGSESTRNWVSFASFRQETRSVVAALASRVGFRESPSRPGVWTRYDAGALAAWVRENCYAGGATGARAKRVPQLVKWVSQRQIKHFLHWFDDRTRNGLQFYSTSKGLIDDLQELHLRVGKRSAIGDSPAKDTELNGKIVRGGPSYVLTVGDVDRLCLDRKKHIETDRYKGLVYCVGVPNHTMITRRNGTVLISSNCWFHSIVAAMLLVRARDMMPFADLSAYAGACMIKNFRDEGGWNPQALDFVTERGCPTSKFWPQRSMSRANDNPQTWADAAKYRVTEGWVDLTKNIYDRDMTFDQHFSALLACVPVAADRYRWSHSTVDMDPLEIDPSRDLQDPERWGIRGWNSWGDSWGDRGMFVMKGRLALADLATAPRVLSAA